MVGLHPRENGGTLKIVPARVLHGFFHEMETEWTGKAAGRGCCGTCHGLFRLVLPCVFLVIGKQLSRDREIVMKDKNIMELMTCFLLYYCYFLCFASVERAFVTVL